MTSTPKNPRIPGGLSNEGKQFIDSLPPAIAQLTNLGNVRQIRDAGHAEFLPRAKRAVAKHKVITETVEIGGVECLSLLPFGSSSEINNTLLYFYGGGYVYGNAYDDMCISAALCCYSGARVVAPQYRLAPEHPWPAAITEGFQVYQALAKNTQPSNLAIAGESAGGNLALTVVQTAKQEGLPLPLRMSLLSPWCDLTPYQNQLESAEPLPQDPTLHPEDLDNYARCYAQGNSTDDPKISPIYGEFDQDFPDTMISTATRDILMPQSLRLTRRIESAGAKADLRIYPGLCHVFECYDEIPEAEISLKALARFLF